MIYQKMLSRSNYLEEKIKMLKKEIESLPDGKICCVHEKNRVKWMYKRADSYEYIRKKNRSLAEKLAQKKYLGKLCSIYQSEQRAINLFLNHYKVDDCSLVQMLSDPAYQELLQPFFSPESQELEEWKNAEYEKNGLHPENLIYPTSSGNIVRSKSEVLIDLYLFTNKIPFRYECALELNGTVVYPDFTIMNKETQKIYYWEHFGMMDNPAYAQKAFSKMQLYTSNQIYPDVQLITTFETRDVPLTTERINQIIQQYFIE